MCILLNRASIKYIIKIFLKNIVESKSSLLNYEKLNSQEEKSFISAVYLFLKISFFLLAFVNLVRIGYSSKVRIIRLKEIKESFVYEKSRYKTFTSRFDNLFSHNGRQRFMKDQEQMISKDILRVIWR